MKLVALPNLRSMCVDKTQVTDEGLMKLVALPHLRTVYVENTKVNDAGQQTFQEATPQSISYRPEE